MHYYNLIKNKSPRCHKCGAQPLRKEDNVKRINRIYLGMKKRCYDNTNSKYHIYGERGIEICEEWKNNSMEFYNWAMANGYEDYLTIDRIDNDLGYCPDNCRWVTKAQNNCNTRGRFIGRQSKYKGVEKHHTQWAARIQKGSKRYYLGTFNTEEEAALAYDKKAKELRGEFAYLNFPDEINE